jgi:peptide-methionine (S)-S-oxide reductase
MKARLAAIILTIFSLAPLPAPAAQQQHVVLAGGCFWGMQAVFESVKGVTKAVAGFSGGAAGTAHYEIVSTGMTGHAESVDVTYDPSKVSFEQLLDVYFLVAHDPTELNRQGPDEGTQYRSEIFYTSDAQRAQAQSYIAKLNAKHVYSGPVVTKVAAYQAFYAAEDYHQDYLVHNPDSPYIVYNDMPKLEKLKKTFPQLTKMNSAPMETLAKLK